MLYPLLKLKRLDDFDEERHAEIFAIAPDAVLFVAPLSAGGSRVFSDSIPDDEASGGIEDGEPFIDVTASPDQIETLIKNAIATAAKIQTLGAIEGQIQAQEQMNRQQNSGIAIARGGLPPINGK